MQVCMSMRGLRFCLFRKSVVCFGALVQRLQTPPQCSEGSAVGQSSHASFW
jgi:hypothetical protein